MQADNSKPAKKPITLIRVAMFTIALGFIFGGGLLLILILFLSDEKQEAANIFYVILPLAGGVLGYWLYELAPFPLEYKTSNDDEETNEDSGEAVV